MLLRYRILSGVLIVVGLLLVWGFVCLGIKLLETMAIDYILGIGR